MEFYDFWFYFQHSKHFIYFELLVKLINILLSLFTDHRSILANTDWKKLWMETGQLNMNRIENNNIETSDSNLPDDNEVNIILITERQHNLSLLWKLFSISQ